MIVWNLAKRNLKLYFRDKTSVFFSLLAVFIIIGLYVLFLGDMMQGEMADMPGARFLMDSWMMAGLMGVVSITTTMGAFGIMVEDRTKNILKDFSASPIKRTSLVGGYLLSSFLIGLIMSMVTFILVEVYLLATGGVLVSFTVFLQIIGIMLLSVIASSSFVFFIVSFFHSSNAFATASTVIGTMIGFLTGIYIPIGSLPDGVQMVIKCFPVSHAGALFRQVMMAEPISVTFAGAPAASVEAFKVNMGVVYQFGDQIASPLFSVIVLIATTVIFFSLATLVMSRKKR